MATTNKTNNFLLAKYVDADSFFLNSLLELKGLEDKYGSTLGLITSIDLSANCLTGEIPKEIGSLLQTFDNLSYVGNHPLTKNCTSKGIPTDVANNGGSSEGNKVNSLYVSIALGFVMGFWGVVAPLFFIRSSRIAYYRKLDHICGKLYGEREALLKFKNHLIDPSNRLSSWVEGGDCCEWTGVVCHNSTGHVNQLHLASLSEPDNSAPDAECEAYYNSLLGGKISPSLLELKHLSSLDLSHNNFRSIRIPKFFGLLESLTYINLSQAQFQGAIPHNLGNLSKLQYLDLGGNNLQSKSLQWVSGLSSLQYLDLLSADLSEATDWVQVTFKLPSLLELHLSGCGLDNDPSPTSVNSTKSLVVLDLSRNSLSSVPKWIFSLHGLVSIDLSVNSLEGPIPDYFGNISFLEVLDLHWNYLNSSIPNSLYSLNRLEFLSLSGNQLQGTISSAIGKLSSVTHLDVSENQLNGQIPLSIGQLSSLEWFDVSENQLNGQIPLSIGQLSSLELFDVSENQLNGTFPLSFGRLESLKTLACQYNLLEGAVLETHFSNLTRLTTLVASHNRLRFEPNSSWIPPFHCEWIELGHWHLGPKFPEWLKFQKKLSYLDISYAGISDVMPTWFLNLPTQFKYLNLSSNQLRGEISYLNVRDIVDLSSNRFIGPLPKVLPTLLFLIVSNNSFSGSLFQLLCSSSSRKQMAVLDIDKNLISGDIPDCFNHCQDLVVLNLGSNNLTGKIPPSLWHLNLSMLNIRNNTMFGELPSTLQNFPFLRMLDLSENHFSGSIPTWIGDKLSSLVILSLRSNNFNGHIPRKVCDLQFLQNLDLAHNNISGVIPKCFNNLSAMSTTSKTNTEVLALPHAEDLYFPSFFLNALLVLKGREDEYGSTLGLVTSMDLSTNSLTGEIPKEIGSLVGLLSLNFSGNLLTGNIPDSIGNMELMESLDLSMNRLIGEIPPNFSNLNFLNHFNVSYNFLTGQIPTSTQLQSFENLSYMGNHLCGPPLTMNCTSKGIPSDIANNGSSSEGSKVNWLYVSIVLGFVMGFWGVVAPLFFIRSWRIAYYRKLDHICGKLYVF
ncbi:LRR receptor-like serine/threonine-protein kinase GSO2 [Gossypium australe]|uniref:LRR receptor-like serine/threonine-protein kinase GSO2 n=1 Tax=Gossypium australe TaxID=47621 RepID=A0A5B6W408_9ROSI|nr:LRR receptor-like serine/threonine-protein kinase GSO2 [Gossypium australe]